VSGQAGTLSQGAAPLRSRFTSHLHEPRTAAILGSALGLVFILCFLTGLFSHLAQSPVSWLPWPSRPAGLYRVTQGVHTLAGISMIPLLLAKLWVVYPKLFVWPFARGPFEVIERLALLPLIGGGLFLAFSGMANTARWYPWEFFFPAAHYWVAWLTIGALIIHIGSKWQLTREHLPQQSTPDLGDQRTQAEAAATAATLPQQRRTFLRAVLASCGAMFLASAGNTIYPLRRISVLAQRIPGVGPQGVPVNKSAQQAGVSIAALDPNYRLILRSAGQEVASMTLAQLRRMPQRSAVLPIACVEGWSTSASWSGVAVRDLLQALPPGATTRDDLNEVLVDSLQEGGLYSKSRMGRQTALDPDTLIALDLNGEPLHIDHGFPARLIAPNRPGVLQTKWCSSLDFR
jgi:DMSO/TMAO reductase YedYZ molybdopterin-dependent catalytic subunit